MMKILGPSAHFDQYMAANTSKLISPAVTGPKWNSSEILWLSSFYYLQKWKRFNESKIKALVTISQWEHWLPWKTEFLLNLTTPLKYGLHVHTISSPRMVYRLYGFNMERPTTS